MLANNFTVRQISAKNSVYRALNVGGQCKDFVKRKATIKYVGCLFIVLYKRDKSLKNLGNLKPCITHQFVLRKIIGSELWSNI